MAKMRFPPVSARKRFKTMLMELDLEQERVDLLEELSTTKSEIETEEDYQTVEGRGKLHRFGQQTRMDDFGRCAGHSARIAPVGPVGRRSFRDL